MKRKAQKNASVGVPHRKRSDVLLAQVQRLTTAHNTLAKAFDQNSEAFSKSFMFADAMIWILRAALNDALNGCVLMTTGGSSQQVDVAGYLKRYEEQLLSQPDAALFHPPTDDDSPIIFGGQS